MATRQNDRHGRESPGKKDDESKERRYPDGENDGGSNGEREIFSDLVQRRLGGGATPTAEAYAKAMRQWQALPGAVQFVAVPKFPEKDSGDSVTTTQPPDEPNDGVDPV